MAHIMFSSGQNALPRRTDSLTVSAASAAKFVEIEEELHDIKRVHKHGQEEDLRMALSRMILRIEELSSLLKEAYRVQTDIQTELTLAKSNMQLALANNEMLEDALNRNVPGSSKDVGWQRWGAKEQKERELEGWNRRSTESSRSLDVSPAQSPVVPGSTTPAEGRFFKFRFGPGSQSATGTTFASPKLPASPRMNQVQSASVGGQFHSSHLTSASLPSLLPDTQKEVETLTAELEKEKKAHAAASAAKEALEAELESLSQALFEEANKMVATERMKLAETEDELREAQAEKEALRSALKLLEQEGRRATLQEMEDHNSQLSSPPFHPSHGRSISVISSLSASSAMAIKSPPSFSAPASPVSARRVLPDPPTSGKTILGHSQDDEEQMVPSASDNLIAAPAPLKPTSQLDPPQKLPLSEDADKENIGSNPKSLSTSSLEVPPAPSPASEGSATPSPNPSPSPSGFTYIRPKSVVYSDAETESPWADVRSATASPTGF